MLTIVFYSTDGQTAKTRAREIVAINKGDYARVVDVGAWDSTNEKCDIVEMMPDLREWQCQKISNVFGDKAVRVEISYDQDEMEVEDPYRKNLGLMPPKEEEVAPVVSEKKAVHKGGGRWYVMAGGEMISGPHDKAEAMKLSLEP